MRGNRTTKTSSSSFNSFTSPNYYPIGQLGLKIEIKWELVRMCRVDKPTKFIPLSANVGLVKLTPFGLPVEQKLKYLVIQSYGVGNIPTQGPYHQWLTQNWKKDPQERMVIINISQVYQSVILNIYATGNQATILGLIPGSDMTCEAAVAKLSFLASQGLKYQQLRELIMKNLRGELTEMEDRQAMKKQNYVLTCNTMLEKNFFNQSQRFKEILLYAVYPRLVTQRQSLSALTHLAENGLKANYLYSDGGTLLHHYFMAKKKCSDRLSYFNYLLSIGVNIHAKDKEGNTALFYALQNDHIQQAKVLLEKGAVSASNSSRIFRAIRKKEMGLLQMMVEFGDGLQYKNEEGRNVVMYTAIRKDRQIFQFLKDNLFLDQNGYLTDIDIYGKNAMFYIQQAAWSLSENQPSEQQ